VAEDPTKKEAETKKNWKDIAEVRMVLYVVPVGLVLALIGYILSQVAGR
jgi:hypothetical protein